MIDGDNVTFSYIENYIRFYAGMTPDEMCRVGWECFHDKFQRKFYPEMKELLGNLEEYGIEIWVITASPELLYQRFIHEELGIPVDRIIGVKSCIRDGIVTDETVRPIPQDAGKAEALNTFIKARPILVGGNSRGDMEMMLESVGLRVIVNPDDTKPEEAMGGKTVKAFWETDPNTIAVRCNDVPDEGYDWACKAYGIPQNRTSSAIQ